MTFLDLPLTGAFGNTTSSENSKKYEQIPMEKSNSVINFILFIKIPFIFNLFENNFFFMKMYNLKFIYKRDYKKIPPEILDKINKKFEEVYFFFH